MKSVMSHRFSQIPQAKIPRSTFDRSHGYKTTFNAGYLVPCYVDEALPGDTFNMKMSAFARLATPIVPFMDNLRMDVFFFAVPYRLVWDNWERFNGAQDNPDDSTDYTVPISVSPDGTGYAVGSLQDYLGLPVEHDFGEHNALHTRCYNLIYNEWFRDQNLQDSVVVDKDDGPDDPTDYVLLRRGKRHDYFTSCLPWPQKGDAVMIPFTGTAPVYGTTPTNGTTGAQQAIFQAWNTTDSQVNEMTMHKLDVSDAVAIYHLDTFDTTDSHTGMTLGSKANYTTYGAGYAPPYASFDDGNITATINALRLAFQLQKFFERDARGGTRYTEVILSHFQVVSPDQRLQRPEFLGGGTLHVNVHPIAQTSSTDATTPQGNLAGMGTVSGSGIGFVKSFTEHCLLLGMVNVRADLNYQQGLDRMWSRQTRYDYYWPAFAHIGEQAVLTKELYAYNGTDDTTVFGYQERYAEYRFKPSVITGKFRSQIASGSLDIWHLAQEFSSTPVLNAAFIVDNPPISRVIAVDTEPHFLLDCYFKLICARPMPVYSVPGFIDHF